MNKLTLPSERKLADRILQAEAEHTSRRLERGWMGMVFGTGTEKPGNVAATAILLAFAGIMILIFAPGDPDSYPRDQMFTTFGSIFTAALGYLFGQATKGGDAS